MGIRDRMNRQVRHVRGGGDRVEQGADGNLVMGIRDSNKAIHQAFSFPEEEAH